MKRTRIVVPTAFPDPPAPHFDDEATIVSARQVVPIARAKGAERSRTLLSLLPVLFAATVFGAAGAIGVNYYENHRQSPVVSNAQSQTSQDPQTSLPASSSQTGTSLSPSANTPGGGVAPAESASPQTESSRSQMQSPNIDPTRDSSAPPERTSVVGSNEERQAPPIKPASPASAGSSSDPSRLVRKRRVHPASPSNEPNPAKTRNRGAGRIQEIFEGPNPR